MHPEQVLFDLIEILLNTVKRGINKIHNDWERYNAEMQTFTTLQTKVNIANDFTREVAYTHFPVEYLANEAVKAFYEKREIDYSAIFLGDAKNSGEAVNQEGKNKCIESKNKHSHITINRIEKLEVILNELNPELANKVITQLKDNPGISLDSLQQEIFKTAIAETSLSNYYQDSIFSYDAITVQELGFYNFYLADNSCAKHSLENEFMTILAKNAGVIDSLYLSENLQCELLNYKENIYDMKAEQIDDMINRKNLKNSIYTTNKTTGLKEVKNNSYTESASCLDIDTLATTTTKDFFKNENNMNNTIETLKERMEEKVNELEKNEMFGFEEEKENDVELSR